MTHEVPPDEPEPDSLDAHEIEDARPFGEGLEDIEGQQLFTSLQSKLFDRDMAPRTLGRWVLLERLGAGAHGVVYAAYDPSLDRRVALKILRRPPSDRAGEALKLRMFREAQALAKVSSPHVVQIHDVAELEGHVCLVMELVAGTTLKAWQGESRTREEIIDRYIKVALGLATIHEAGIVHRDVKPDNVLVTKDRVVIADFGLVFAPADAPVQPGDPGRLDGLPPTALELSLTEDGAVVGTLGYMAPEQLQGREVTRQSDQFAYCVSIYEALTGTRPFRGRTPAEIVEAMKRPWLRGPAGSRLPRWLRTVLARGLAFAPDRRFASMTALAHRLERGRNRGRRIRTLVLATGGVATACGVGYWFWNKPDPCDVSAELTEILRPIAEVTASRSDSASTWDALMQSFERSTNDWAYASIQACKGRLDPNPNSSPEFVSVDDARLACVDDAQSSLLTFNKEIAELHGTSISHVTADDLQHALDEIPNCNEPRSLIRFQAVQRNAPEPNTARSLREDLAGARAQVLRGHLDTAEKRAKTVLGHAQSANLSRLEADAAYLLGRIFTDQGRGLEARSTLEGAYYRSTLAHDEELQARIAVAIAKLLADTFRDTRGANEWLRIAHLDLIATHQYGECNALYAEFLEARGITAFIERKYEEAAGYHENALTLRKRIASIARTPWDSIDVVKSTANLAITQAFRSEESNETLRHGKQAYDNVTRILGDKHPFSVSMGVNLGILQMYAGNAEDAKTTLQKFLDSTRNDTSESTLRALGALGAMAASEGDRAKELEIASQIEAIHRKIASDYPERMMGYDRAMEFKIIAQARMNSDELAAATSALERAVELLERLDPDAYAFTLADLGKTLQARGRTKEALVHIAQALPTLWEIRTAGRADAEEMALIEEAEIIFEALTSSMTRSKSTRRKMRTKG